MHVAIIVPTADPTRQPARRALETARRTTDHLDVDVVPVVATGSRFTFSGSINKGFDQTKGADAWVLLNDDCFMDDGWLDAMLATARRHPRVGQVGALLRYPDGATQHAGGFLTVWPWEYVRHARQGKAPLHAMRDMAGRRTWKGIHSFSHHRHVRRGMRLDFLTAASVLITRPCRAKVGRFDERFAMGAEDVDYSLRCLDAGFELALATDATGEHLEGASGGGVRPAHARSVAAFRAKWSPDEVLRLTRGRRGVIDPVPDR